ncbi:alpha/beta hydrolase family protein [Alloscardovia criceti]|uniref:alpha/beta hydrolase family protein n=1 Tax=Alloscardovia criceti TaxID=356828 RepID=UPI0003A72651|nr:alpha/beta hydrolase [Alloscardovia criceti]
MSNEKRKMKTWKKVVIGLIAVPVALAAVFGAWYLYSDNKADIKNGYNKEIETGGEIEAKYLLGGNLTVNKTTFKEENPIKKVSVFYPEEMENSDKTYPMILVMNGTGGKATKYEPQFEMYASWGFIVVGTQDKGTGTGKTTVKVLNDMLVLNEDEGSLFYHKIDLENIGLTGFSQGGAGVFNVLTKYEEAKYIKTAVPLSPVSEYMTAQVTDYTYDSSLVKCPILIMAGTEGEFEMDTVIPIELLNEQYDKITSPKAMARRIGMTHDQMMYSAGGYVMAWFRWQLQGDEEAARAFIGDSPELLNNPDYQGQRIDLEE